MALALALMVIGYSTHLYLPIRAAQHPAINEGAPDSWATAFASTSTARLWLTGVACFSKAPPRNAR